MEGGKGMPFLQSAAYPTFIWGNRFSRKNSSKLLCTFILLYRIGRISSLRNFYFNL